MPAPRNRKHLLIRTAPKAEEYTPHARRIEIAPVPGPADRAKHSAGLRAALLEAERANSESRKATGISVHGAQPGLYVQFESPAGIELKLESLENKRKGIELCAVSTATAGPSGQQVQLATVFVPEGKVKHFIARFEQYANQLTKTGRPRHRDMVDRIAGLRRATLRALWTDDVALYPHDDDAIWWEVWLRRDDGNELARLLDFAAQRRLEVGQRRLAFEDRVVALVRGTARQLSDSLDVLNDVAEVRKAKENAAFLGRATPGEQATWVAELKARTSPPEPEAPAVCILDTGVTRGHPLLEDMIAETDATAVDPTWGPQDDGGGPGNRGHGTEMAGLTAFGDLAVVLASNELVEVRHRLESVKILPPTGKNEPELYGAITAEAVMRPEVKAPARPRVFALAVTTIDSRGGGQPTSWSAAIDALASGRTFDPVSQGLHFLDEAEEKAHRLFVVSAGNVAPGRLAHAHLDRSDVEAVHDPSHAWNALTVGAHTEKAVITDSDRDGWSPVAPPGELSPWSTTSVGFDEIWPIKPDVVFEGGNIASDGKNFDEAVPELCLLSTFHRPGEKTLVRSYATSAATAQVARIAAVIRVEYPAFWPETVRALIVHSSRWTRRMAAHFDKHEGKRARAKLVRRYGFGVPHLDLALRSANDSLTLVAQGSLHPFSGGKMAEMHLHDLPWPKGVLQELADTPVRLRVTLSYFIEPNPGRRGWKRRHRYASHGVRFDVKAPTETIDEFRKRLNQRALDADEDRPHTGADIWFLGEQTRNKGSIHSDTLDGTAADLAERGVVGVFPISGWWKDQPARDRSHLGARYSLIVSLETEAQGVDIWTPVAQEIGVPVDVLIEV